MMFRAQLVDTSNTERAVTLIIRGYSELQARTIAANVAGDPLEVGCGEPDVTLTVADFYADEATG